VQRQCSWRISSRCVSERRSAWVFSERIPEAQLQGSFETQMTAQDFDSSPLPTHFLNDEKKKKKDCNFFSYGYIKWFDTWYSSEELSGQNRLLLWQGLYLNCSHVLNRQIEKDKKCKTYKTKNGRFVNQSC